MQQVIYTDARGVESTRPQLIEFRGKQYYRPEDLIAKKGLDLKHQLKLLKRRLRYQSEPSRSFPSIINLLKDAGPLTTNEDNELSSRTLTALYVQQYIRLNHLKEC